MIYKLRPVIKNYAWGGEDFLAELFNLEKNGTPKAEAWFGSHKDGASIIENKALNKWLEEKNQPPLPYLLKVLDMKIPLSIQAHPNKKEAENGFWRENARGIKLNSPNRNYKDDNHKPEMSIALCDSWLLQGIAKKEWVLKNLAKRDSLKEMAVIWEKYPEKIAIQKLFQIKEDIILSWLMPIINSYRGEDKTNPDYWLKIAFNEGFRDSGLLAFYFMNIIHLKKGERVYQKTGLLHAYLEGKAVELMAASDNVLRAGLTNKHRDLFELLAILKINEEEKAEKLDFDLEEISLKEEETYQTNLKINPAILLVLEGKAKIDNLTLNQGEAVLITDDFNLKALDNLYAVLTK